jgi:hypothetical protein
VGPGFGGPAGGGGPPPGRCPTVVGRRPSDGSAAAAGTARTAPAWVVASIGVATTAGPAFPPRARVRGLAVLVAGPADLRARRQSGCRVLVGGAGRRTAWSR